VVSESTALVRLETCTAVQIFEPGFIDPVIEQIEAEARSEASRLDISTEGNRKALASLAYKVARSKTFIDTQRLALVADEKKRLKRIDEEGRRIWTRLEALQDEVRKPLTEWEEADKRRIAGHEAALAEIMTAGSESLWNWQSLSAEAMRDRWAEIARDTRNWEEFAARAAGVKVVTRSQIAQALEKRMTHDREQAELAKLRAEAAEREQREREERIAREATEKAERQAREREEAITREANFQRQKAESALKNAEREAAAAKDLAERSRKAAIEAERKRVADKESREKVEQDRREASARIRKRVLGEISEAIASLNVPPEQADVIASALAAGTIPHITVVF
jgi:colicin import membrane protein